MRGTLLIARLTWLETRRRRIALAALICGLLFLAVHLAMFGGGLNSNWDALRVVLGLALLGAVLGFIPYNFNPASIFMGDTGSMFLGYACAVMIILMSQDQSKWLLASMVMFALPVLDTVLAFARRYVNGRPLFSADRFHFHHLERCGIALAARGGREAVAHGLKHARVHQAKAGGLELVLAGHLPFLQTGDGQHLGRGVVPVALDGQRFDGPARGRGGGRKQGQHYKRQHTSMVVTFVQAGPVH